MQYINESEHIGDALNMVTYFENNQIINNANNYDYNYIHITTNKITK